MEENTRAALWRNVSALMTEHWGKENLTRLRTEAGVGANTVSEIKSGARSVGVDTVEKIAKVFGVHPWQLIHPEGTKAAPAIGVSKDALEIAQQIDRISDGEMRDWVLANCRSIAFNPALKWRRPPGDSDSPGEAAGG